MTDLVYLDDLYAMHPVLTEVLAHVLNAESEDVRLIQSLLSVIVTDIHTLTENNIAVRMHMGITPRVRDVILRSCHATLQWLDQNKTHPWYRKIGALVSALP